MRNLYEELHNYFSDKNAESSMPLTHLEITTREAKLMVCCLLPYKKTSLSEEGTTLGDSLAMSMYGIVITPLMKINSLVKRTQR